MASSTFLLATLIAHLFLGCYLPFVVGDNYPTGAFVRTRETQFVVNGHPFYVNGFNAYFLTYVSVDPSSRPVVSQLLTQAAAAGLTVARTWAFNNGGFRALQTAPRVFNETVFQALDFVLHEAKSNGLRLILSLSNNYPSMGGKAQYVQWARKPGLSSSPENEDAFFYDPTVKSLFKDYIKTVLTRVNSITGVAYRNDPTIFAWELINEARCADPSGNTVQAWIQEMAAYVKTIDSNHLLETGFEGFYGASTPSRQTSNPGGFGGQVGTDFLRNNQVPWIDFASVHSYPDQWLSDQNFEDQLAFLKNWVSSHLDDAQILRKPVLFAEFGLSSKDSSFSANERDRFFSTIYNLIYSSASSGGPGAGGLFWQLLPEALVSGMGDGYEIVLSQDSSTASLIASQSKKMLNLNQVRWRKLLTWRP